MNLYLVKSAETRTSYVVAAYDSVQARVFTSRESGAGHIDIWLSEERSSCAIIGQASKGIPMGVVA